MHNVPFPQDKLNSVETEQDIQKNWCVYLLRCSDGTLYCGITTDVKRRVAMHNGLLPGGAKYTSGRRPVTLIARSEKLAKSMALRLEYRIKKLPSGKKERFLIACRDGIPALPQDT